VNKLKKNTGRTFRFPFDIDRRVFLILAGVFFILSWQPVNSLFFPRLTAEKISKKISANFDEEYQEFENDLSRFTKTIPTFSSFPNDEFDKYNSKNWSFFISQNDSITFWSKAITNSALFQNSEVDTLLNYDNNGEIGVFIRKEINSSKGLVSIIGKFPLYKSYKLHSKLLPSNFAFTKSSGFKENFGYRLETLDFTKMGKHKIVSIHNAPRFQLIEESSFLAVTDRNFTRFFIASLAFIFFGVSIHTFFKVSVSRNPALYFGLLLLTIVAIRLLTYTVGFPDDFSEFYLFNPGLYSSSAISCSLGDVFINACLLFWVLFFFIMNIQNKIWKLKSKSQSTAFISVLSVIVYITAYVSIKQIRSIVFDSRLRFDTTDVLNLSPYNIIGLGTMLLIFVNYSLLIMIFNRYLEKYKVNKYVSIIIPLIGVVAYLIIFQEIEYVFFIVSLWTCLTIFLLRMKSLHTKFDFNSYKLIYWLIYLSASCVIIIHYFDTHKELKLQQHLGKKLLYFESKSTENKLISISKKIKNDVELIKKNNDEDIIEHLNQRYILQFEPRYSTNIKIYQDTNSKAPNENISSDQQFTVFTNDSVNLKLIDAEDLKEYRLRFIFKSYDIIVSLKQAYQIEDLSLNQLTSTLTLSQNRNISDYQFAFYTNNVLTRQSQIDAFPINLPQDVSKSFGIVNLPNTQNFSEVAVHQNKRGVQRTVIIKKKKNTLYKISTTYAYIFTIIFLLVSLYILGNIIARSNFKRKRFINLLGLTLRMRIHLAILIVELISLSIIGGITIYLFSSEAEKTAKQNSFYASNEIKKVIQDANLARYSNLTDSSSACNGLIVKNTVSPFIEKHNVSINLYRLDGSKYFTSVSKKVANLLPDLASPKALSSLRINKDLSYQSNQSLGDLGYYTIYTNIFDTKRKQQAILETPNFNSQYSISKSNSNIVTMLINIYALIFLLSSLLAFYITKRLTVSFTKIIGQFSKINLTQTNEPLQWPYSDEIGLLIKEYNRTLVKLENSTALLAKSEREIAWREMARQIAHEIKNPLTPMSLSLQSLQAAIKRNDPNVPQLTQKMTSTVLEQIGVLTRTASNFSEFATMTDIDAKRESLLDILETTTGIYSDSEETEFLFVFPKVDVFVNVDKVKMIRVLTNVIQNAMQSIPDELTGQIILTTSKQPNNLIDITIEDNGNGIPKDLQSKIFEPNFTTKSSGSGLGLAMCKDIITKTGGNIYFVSKEGEGTAFHILIPLYKEEDEQ